MKMLASSTRTTNFGRALLACLLVVSTPFVAADGGQTSAGAAQRRPVTGEWRVDFDRGQPDLVSLTIIRGDAFHGDGTRSDGPVALAELQGLTREQAFGAPRAVKFRIVREAGTFECEGRFGGGHGAGTWRLVPDESFVAAMRARGYALTSDKELFESALFNVNTKDLDDLTAAGYKQLPFDKLIETRIFNVNRALVEEMRAAGYPNLTIEELVDVRIFNVDRKFIDEIKALGFGRQPLRQLIDMRSQNVTPEYVCEMRDAGFNLSVNELVDFKVFNVTKEFVKEVREAGLPAITPSGLVDLKVFNIDAAFVRRARAKGVTTVDEIVNMRTNGRAN